MTRISIISLGCAKNLVDSELILGMLEEHGASIVNELDKADVVIVNTCGFIADAQRESIEAILQIVDLKNTEKIRKVIVAGCLAQIFGEELQAQIPMVDAWVGVNDFPAISKDQSLRRLNRDQTFLLLSAFD